MKSLEDVIQTLDEFIEEKTVYKMLLHPLNSIKNCFKGVELINSYAHKSLANLTYIVKVIDKREHIQGLKSWLTDVYKSFKAFAKQAPIKIKRFGLVYKEEGDKLKIFLKRSNKKRLLLSLERAEKSWQEPSQ